MSIDSIYFEFAPTEDRLLVRVHYDGANEMLFWFTRRLVKLFWPVLVKLAGAPPEIQMQASPEARTALVNMKHEAAVKSLAFERVPAKADRKRPNGDAPLLVVTVHATRKADGNTTLTLCPEKGEGWDLTVTDRLLHGVMKALQEVVQKAGWDVALELPRAGAAAAPGGATSPN